MKKILSLVALMMMIVMEANAANKTISLVPGLWATDNATFAAYAWVGEENAWFPFTEVSGVYVTQVPEEYTGIILTRINPEGTDTDPWKNVWNQTNDIDFTAIADGSTFTITGWGGGDYTVESAVSPIDDLKDKLGKAIAMAELFDLDTTAAKATLANTEATEADLKTALTNLVTTIVPKAQETIALARKFFQTFDSAAGAALEESFAAAEAALGGTDFNAMYEAAMTLFAQGLVAGQPAMTKVNDYLEKMENETVNKDLAAINTAVAANDLNAVLAALRQMKNDLPSAAQTYAAQVQALIDAGKEEGKDVSAMETALSKAMTAYLQFKMNKADLVDVGFALYELIKAVDEYKNAPVTVTIESMVIVGDFLGLEATEEDANPNWNPANGWAMTQDTENPAIWTLVQEFTAEAKKYEYKATANGNWDDYVLPPGDNANFIFGTEGYPEGDYILTFTANTEEHTLTLDVKSNMPKDIEISPAEGDIAAALAEAKKDIAKVGDITINLTEGVTYTIGATLTAPNNIFINGNNATVTVNNDMTDNFITLDGTEKFAMKSETEASDHKLISSVVISDLTITSLQGALVKDAQKTLVKKLVINNSIIEIPAAGKNVLDFNGKGYVGEVVVTNSTIWAKGMNTGFFAQYGSRPKNVNAEWLQVFDFENSTIVNIANGKNFCDLKQNGTAQNVYTLKNNIFVDCGKSGQTVVGFNKGQTSATPVWDVTGNYFEAGGECKNAAEIEKAGKKDEEDIVKDCVEGKLAFADADNGDFNGEFTLAEGAEAPKDLGDPRWTITFSEAPVEALYYIVGTMTDWVNDGVKEELKLEKNEEAGEGVEEYMITLDFEAGAEFKVVKPEGEAYVWYPDGVDNNYVIENAGTYTVYFRPNGDGGSDWYLGVILVVDNETDGINAVSAADQNAVIYNLSGQKVMKAQKGLYIVNGKKVLMK